MGRRPRPTQADRPPDPGKEVIRPNPGPQTDFLSTVADFALFGGSAGSGKSFGLLLEAMRHSDNPDYRSTLFRRTLKQIQKQGSLWDSSEELYPKTGAVSNLNSMTWRWPSGAEVQMAGLEYEKSIDNYLGAQIDMMGFDELTTFSRRQILWLISRNRGRAGILPYVRATCNPDADSWVADWVKWYVNPETGYPVKHRSGRLRWFAIIEDKIYWASSRRELIDAHGKDTLPLSFTFIPALLEDNPKLLETNPQYRAKLRAMSTVDNLRLEKGNWKVRAEAGKVFSRFWFKAAPTPAGPGCVDCRFWDLACLVAGTMIETSRGPVPIEQITRDDTVLTRAGFRRVVWSGKTKDAVRVTRVEFSDGSVVTGTPDHRVWTKNRGWVPLAQLTSGDYTVKLNQEGNLCREGGGGRPPKPRSLNSTVLVSRGGRVGGISRGTPSTRPKDGRPTWLSTATSGNSTSAPYRPATTFITPTTITTTTPPGTSDCSPGQITPSSTTDFESLTARNQLGSNGSEMSGISGHPPRTGNTPARAAVTSSDLGGLGGRGSVPPRVAPGSVTGSGTVPVYDIEVEGEHEFFANGVLVHNSTEKKQKGDDPDWTAAPLLRKCGSAWFFLDCVSVQEAPAEIEQLMVRTSRQDALRSARDGARYLMRWELEPGSASVREAARLSALFAGLDARAVRPREHGEVSGKWDKVSRSTPLAAQARAGNVRVCPDSWPPEGGDSITVDDFLAEMHGFPDRPHDDVPDAASGAFNCLPNFITPSGGNDFTVGPPVMPPSWENW